MIANMTQLCLSDELPVVPNAYAVISSCGRYRYRLSRHWGPGAPLLFVMLNPSTADAFVDDPTIRRCAAFARAAGYDSLDVVNLFAWRATNPKAMPPGRTSIGPENDEHIRTAAIDDGRRAVLAHGRLAGERMIRGKAVVDLLRSVGCELLCLKTNDDGSPAHPLYLSAGLTLKGWPIDAAP